jgi:hypothetical protein
MWRGPLSILATLVHQAKALEEKVKVWSVTEKKMIHGLAVIAMVPCPLLGTVGIRRMITIMSNVEKELVM